MSGVAAPRLIFPFTNLNPANPMTTLRRCLPVILASGLLSSPAAFAQTNANKPEKPEDPIQLSEFTVKESSDNGYIASETVTGPRLATKIADLPYPISVVTSEFMRDFDVFDFSSSV